MNAITLVFLPDILKLYRLAILFSLYIGISNLSLEVGGTTWAYNIVFTYVPYPIYISEDDIMLCSLQNVNQHFGGTCYLQLKG